MAELEIKGLTKTYGKKVGVSDIDLKVNDGEFFVILGPSGAGKTTTLKSVGGLIDIDSGEIWIGGQDVTWVEPYHRNVAMAFESYALYPQKTVFENLASPLRSGRTGTYAKEVQEERINQVTKTLGINQLLHRFPRELSNGQRQRVALGRVLVRPADIYLLDEPLSHLDAKLRAAMRVELKQLGAMSSTTTLYVTHDYQEALALADRIAVLRKGKIVQSGLTGDLWNTPVDTFVAKALGQPEINLIPAELIDGELVAANGGLRFAVDDSLGLSAGSQARLGIRPRDLALADGPPDAKHVNVQGRVVIAERLGRRIEVVVDVNGTQMIVVVEGQAPAEGSNVTISVPKAHVHVFEAEPESATDDADPDGETLRLGGVAKGE
jgi:ABC-type sugar transport system ATPase subunit